MTPELAGLPPLLAAARRAAFALSVAAEVADAKGLPYVAAHLTAEAQALLGAIECARPYACSRGAA
jgi:hypothetical protein